MCGHLLSTLSFIYCSYFCLRLCLLISLGIAISHFSIDYLKWLVTKKTARTTLKIVIFLSDQVIHIAVLFGLSFLLTDLNAFGGAVDSFLYENIGFTIKIDLFLAYLVSVMFLIQPANIINKYILSVVFGSAEASEDNNKNNKEARAGAIIGILERVVMYSFSAFLAWYSIFPVVLAAKTFARFEKFRKDDSYYSFSEKYIVGTLLSISYVGACLILGLAVA